MIKIRIIYNSPPKKRTKTRVSKQLTCGQKYKHLIKRKVKIKIKTFLRKNLRNLKTSTPIPNLMTIQTTVNLKFKPMSMIN